MNLLGILMFYGYYSNSNPFRKENLVIPSQIFSLISASLFFLYGLQCVFSQKMVAEFNRYRLGKFRKLVGVLEIMGAFGQLVGFWIPGVLILASGGLALLMICGVWARLRIRDPWFSFLPAILLGLINAAVVWLSLI